MWSVARSPRPNKEHERGELNYVKPYTQYLIPCGEPYGKPVQPASQTLLLCRIRTQFAGHSRSLPGAWLFLVVKVAWLGQLALPN